MEEVGLINHGAWATIITPSCSNKIRSLGIDLRQAGYHVETKGLGKPIRHNGHGIIMATVIKVTPNGHDNTFGVTDIVRKYYSEYCQ